MLTRRQGQLCQSACRELRRPVRPLECTGKLLIVVPDINGKKVLPGAFVEAAKIISGGDDIDIDGKNKIAVQEALPAKLLFVTNDLLRLEDDSAAVFNRFKCLKFVHHFFPAGHRLDDPKRPQDEALEQKLAGELPGILNWALGGLRRLDANGFTAPKASAKLQETLEAEGAARADICLRPFDKGRRGICVGRARLR